MVKIAIVSDTHGQWQDVLQALKAEEGLEQLFFLGDLVEDGKILAQSLQLSAQIVRGNCDSFYSETGERQVTLGGVHFLLCHGDAYGVKESLNRLRFHAQEEGIDIVCFGHTHVPMYEEDDDIIFLNPGSASRPRSFDQAPSWGLLELSDEGCEKKVKKYTKKDLPKR